MNEQVICVCPNDAFVTAAWGEALGATGKVRMLADPHLELTKALDIVLDAEAALGYVPFSCWCCLVVMLISIIGELEVANHR